MDSLLAIPEEIEAQAAAGRSAIEAHLAQLPAGEERDSWQSIAKVYSCGIEDVATALVDVAVGTDH